MLIIPKRRLISHKQTRAQTYTNTTAADDDDGPKPTKTVFAYKSRALQMLGACKSHTHRNRRSALQSAGAKFSNSPPPAHTHTSNLHPPPITHTLSLSLAPSLPHSGCNARLDPQAHLLMFSARAERFVSVSRTGLRNDRKKALIFARRFGNVNILP